MTSNTDLRIILSPKTLLNSRELFGISEEEIQKAVHWLTASEGEDEGITAFIPDENLPDHIAIMISKDLIQIINLESGETISVDYEERRTIFDENIQTQETDPG